MHSHILSGVDDGSKDKSGVICDDYQKIYPDKIKVYHKQNEGLMLTRLFGYRKAQGEYILNCDSDDMLEENSVETILNYIDKYRSDVLIYNAFTLKANKKSIYTEDIFCEKPYCKVSKKAVVEEFYRDFRIVSMCMKCFKKACIKLENDYSNYSSIQNGEDTFLSNMVFESAKTYIYINKPLYIYRMGSGMTNKFDVNYYNSFKQNYLYMKNSILFDYSEKCHDFLLSKYFFTLGRSITQSRFRSDMTLKKRKEYFLKIYNDFLFQENVKYYPTIRYNLKKSYRFFCDAFIKKRFLLLHILLTFKNIISSVKGDSYE